MTTIVEQYWARALKISRQHEAGEINFADLTGFCDEFAASFTEQLGELPERQRAAFAAAMEAKLQQAIADCLNENASCALNELLVAINRTPIY